MEEFTNVKTSAETSIEQPINMAHNDNNMNNFDPRRLLKHGATLAIAATTALIIAGCSSGSPDSNGDGSQASSAANKLPDGSYDMIDGQHWQLAGVTARRTSSGESLVVHNTDLAIVTLPTGKGSKEHADYPNHPVNLYGTRINVAGDFSVTAKLSNVTQEAAWSVYAKPPIISDEFRSEQGTVDMSVNGNAFRASISEAADGNNTENVSGTINTSTKHVIQMSDINGKLSFNVDGTKVGDSVDDHSMFDSNKAYIGMDARAHDSTFTVDQLSVKQENGNAVSLSDTRNESIKVLDGGLSKLAEKKRHDAKLGVAVALGPLVDDPEYQKLIGNFNTWSLENVGKMQNMHPLPGDGPGSYNFADRNAVLELAQKSGVEVHGHALLFAEAQPEWYQALPTDQRAQIDTTYITKVITNDKQFGVVKSYDVVNEPLEWLQKRSMSDLIAAYQAAHAADPKTSLVLNEYGMETDSNRLQQVLSIAEKLKAVGITAEIGFQAHIDNGDTNDGDTQIDPQVLQQTIQTVKNAGFKMRFSEVDISYNDNGNDTEHAIPAQIVAAYINDPSITSVYFWGATDAYTSGGSIDPQTGVFSPGNGVMWDVKYKPTRSYHDVLKVLQK
jgi:endo-1,4-beta-xylanase